MNWFVEHPEVTRYILEHERKNVMLETLPSVVVEPIDIPMEDDPLHTVDHPFCGDKGCPCNNSQARQELRKQEWNGLLTDEERMRLYHGRNI